MDPSDVATPLQPPQLVRELTPSLLGPVLLELLLEDAGKREQMATTIFQRALSAEASEDPELEWGQVLDLTSWVCAQMQLPAPPPEKLRLLFDKLARPSAMLSLQRFQKFFSVLLQQVHSARGASQRNSSTSDVEKPPLQPQVARLAALLNSAQPCNVSTTNAGVGTLLHDALASMVGEMDALDTDVQWLNGRQSYDADELLGWDAWASSGMAFSADTLTAAKGAQVTGWGGAIGPALCPPGVSHFAVRVWQPVDDAFFVGVCSPDAVPTLEPKRNEKAVVWSGGSTARPGTVRLFGEKFRQMPTFADGDVIGVIIDFDSSSVRFFLNGEQKFYFGAAARGPLCPFFSVHHSGPAATLLTWRGVVPAAPTADGSSAALDEELSSARFIDVDGSMLEGGGQVLRVSLGCAALLRVPLHIHSVRAGRSNPGLGSQHTAGAKLVADCCNGLLSPDSINGGTHCTGVTSLRLWPSVGGVRGGAFAADTRSAGATTLLLQAALPCCLLGAPDATTRLVLRGGTNVKWSPPVDHTRMALLPLLHCMGVGVGDVHIDLQRRGFYPLGGGEVRVHINSVRSLQPLRLDARGDAVSVSVLVFARGLAKPCAKDVAASIRSLLSSSTPFGSAEILVEVDTEDARPQEEATEAANAEQATSFEDGNGTLTRKQRRALHLERQALNFGACGIQFVALGSLGGVITADVLLLEGFESAPALGVKALEEQWAAGGAVDEHLADQLILYMAMAGGASRVLCNGPTSISSLHLQTATALTTQITGVAFTLTPCAGADEAPCVLIGCEGMSWINEVKWCGHVLGVTADHGLVLNLSCDSTWESRCLEELDPEGIVREKDGVRWRHVTLLPMRALNGKSHQRCRALINEINSLTLPRVEFHPVAGTAERSTSRSVFFALRHQKRWRILVEQIATMIGAEGPGPDSIGRRLFHMTVWNTQNGDPYRSVGDVCLDDFPYDVE